MKLFGVLTFAIVAAFCLVTSCYGVNFTHGMIEPHDSLIYHEYVVMKPQPNRMVSRDVTYPAAGVRPSKPRIITAVRAYDMNTDKVYGSGFASITSGGPKNSYLNLRLQSFRNLGLNFSVDVWGI